jgi:uncharacterized protein YndB with AHSA1/START domain
MSAPTKAERGFTIVRRLDAPRELVFQAWTDPAHLEWFAGAKPTQSRPATVDLRVGGAWRVLLVENQDRSYMTGGIYREIVVPGKLVFTWGAVDGWPEIDPSQPDEAPVVTVILNDLGGATEMVFHLGFADTLTEDRVRDWLATGMFEGWNDTLDRLDPYLPQLGRGSFSG